MRVMPRWLPSPWWRGPRDVLLRKVLIAALALTPLWIAWPIPTIDGPQHLFAAYLLRYAGRPDAPFASYFDVHLPYTSFAFELVTAGLQLVMPLRLAAQCTLSLIALLQTFGFVRLIETCQGPRSPWIWLAALFPYTASFYFGFVNYAAGVGMGLWALSVACRICAEQRAGRAVRARAWIALAALLLATAAAHSFAAAATGLVVGLVLMGASPRRKILANLAILFLLAMPTLAWMARVAASAGKLQHASVLAGSIDLGSYYFLVRNLFETPLHTLWHANALVGAAAVITLLAALRGRREAHGPALGLAGLLLLLPMVPDHIEAWDKIRMRFASWVLVVAVAGAALPVLRSRVRAAFEAAVLAATLVGLGMTAYANASLATMQREFEAGIGRVTPPPKRSYYAAPDPDRATRPGSSEAVNLHLSYAIAEGTIFPRVFAGRREVHLLNPKEPFWRDTSPRDRRGPGDETLDARWRAQARMGLIYDEMLVWDAPEPELALFRAYGYRVLFHQGDLYRLAPPHRRLSLRVPDMGGTDLVATVLLPDQPWPIATEPLRAAGDGTGDLGATVTDLPATRVGVALARAGAPASDAPLSFFEIDLGERDEFVKLER